MVTNHRPMFALTLHRSILRVASLAPAVVLGGGIVVVALGGWLLASDRAKTKEAQGARLQRAILDEKIAGARQKIEQLEVELPPEQERALRSEKLIGELKGLTSTWSWFGGNREQQRLNRERLAKVESMHVEAVAKASTLQQELQRLRWEAERLEAERTKIETLVQAEDERRGSVWYRGREAWLLVRGWMLMAGGMYLAGTVLVQAGTRRWRSRRAAAV